MVKRYGYLTFFTHRDFRIHIRTFRKTVHFNMTRLFFCFCAKLVLKVYIKVKAVDVLRDDRAFIM